MVHELKVIKKYFEKLVDGSKNFELRKNDRNFSVGDILTLNEIDENGFYTGNYISRKVLYILKDCPEYGLPGDYCILSLGSVYDMAHM